MAECTNVELEIARKTAKLPRWQVAQSIGVSEETVRRWETGETRPEPDDVYSLERLYRASGLWHRWMRSTYDSYRQTWPEMENRDLPLAVMNVRHQMADVMALQDTIERDALDGRIDNITAQQSYERELKQMQAAIAEALTKMSGKES